MNSQEKRREKRKSKQDKWKKENPTLVGIRVKPDESTTINLSGGNMSKIDKATAIPFPKDNDPVEDIPHEDVMHRVVNHAHRRDPKKKW